MPSYDICSPINASRGIEPLRQFPQNDLRFMPYMVMAVIMLFITLYGI